MIFAFWAGFWLGVWLGVSGEYLRGQITYNRLQEKGKRNPVLDGNTNNGGVEVNSI